MGLLTTFKFTGVISQPQISETINVEPVIWNMTRPSQSRPDHLRINNTITNVWNSDSISIQFDLNVSSYWEDEPTLGDHFLILLSWQAETKQGFVNLATVQFSGVDGETFLDIDESADWTVSHNLKTVEISDSFETNNPSITSHALGEPCECSLQTRLSWIFLDPNTADHHLTITTEIIYFNSTIFAKAILPIELSMLIE
jgi:hypothetical protein